MTATNHSSPSDKLAPTDRKSRAARLSQAGNPRRKKREFTSHPSKRSTNEYALKRALDLCISSILLLTLAPLFFFIGIAIILTSKGPVFFKQQRLGLNEKPFQLLKFRSMCTDSDKLGPQFTSANDPRITPVGRWLRKTSIDELPQLINVLCGQMSLFGPRPYIGFELKDCTPEQRNLRASTRPGISGLSQTKGRSSLSQSQTIRYDLLYVRKCSLRFDAYLFLQTLSAVLKRRGTN